MIDDDLEFEGGSHDDFEDFEESEQMDLYEDEHSFGNEDAELYLDEADRGSATKRRYTTRTHAGLKNNRPVISGARKSTTRSNRRRRRVVAAAAKRVAQRHAPAVVKAANQALKRRIPDGKVRIGLARFMGSRFVFRAASIAANRATSAITARQIIRLPMLAILTAAAVEAAQRSRHIDETEAQVLARKVFDALAMVDMVVQLGASALGEDVGEDGSDWIDDEFEYEDERELEGFEADDAFEDLEEYDGEAARAKPPCNCRASKGQTVATSRALRNAARQLLRMERRLTGQS